MKKGLLLVLVLVLALSVGAFAFQNEPTGFRGVEWGDTILQQEGMEFKRDLTEWIAHYTRPGDVLSIGMAGLTSIEYQYYFFGKDMPRQFGAVFITYEKDENYFTLEKICTLRFGDTFGDTGSSLNLGNLQQVWRSEEVTIELRFDFEKDTGSLYIYSVAITGESFMLAQRERGQSKDSDW